MNSRESISDKLVQSLLPSAEKRTGSRENKESKEEEDREEVAAAEEEESDVNMEIKRPQDDKMDLQSENSRSSPLSSLHFDMITPRDSLISPRHDMNNGKDSPPNLKTSFPPSMAFNTNGHGPNALLHALPFHPMSERNQYRFATDDMPAFGNGIGRFGDSLIPKGDPMEAKLQEMLRYNMDKYANQNLDTLQISRRVRELLSVHNIGQRLFAKYVLGLSQGTVSELLSKPKPWDKLTEKGRDSYRKMHAWGCDEEAVMLLKSLIPKKSK